MLSADPGSTWMRFTSDDPIYPVKYKGRSCFPLTCMSSAVKEMQGTFGEVWRQSSTSFSLGTWVRKTSAFVRASCRASLVDLDSLRSSYKVMRAGMLAN